MKQCGSVPIVSFVLIQVFWMSMYSAGMFRVIGGVSGQIAILIIWSSTLLLLTPKRLSAVFRKIAHHSVEVSALTAFVVVNLVYLLLGRGELAYAYCVHALLLIIAYTTVIVHLENHYRRYLQAGVIVTLVLGLTAVYVLPTIYANPFAGRFREYESAGMVIPEVWYGSWGFFMAYAIALPCCIAVAHRQHGLSRLFLYALCASMVVLVFLSTFAASIILMLIGFAALLLLSIRKARTYFIMAVIIATYVVMVGEYDVGRIPQLEQMGDKITLIFSVTPGGNYDDPNDPRIRFHLMKNSFNTFVAHPLFGTGLLSTSEGQSVGNHSGIVDGLAQFGVLGIVWYLAFMTIFFRRLFLAWRVDRDSLVHKARLVTFVLFLIGAMANPMFFDSSIAALVFILAVSRIGTRGASAIAA